MKLEFSWQIFEKYISNFIKIRPEGAELFPAGGRTDMTKLTDAFRSFEKAPKKIQSPSVLLIYMNEAHDDKGHSTLHPADKSRWVQTVRYQLHSPMRLLSSTSRDL
jgi:hypothetical protein